VEKAFIAQVVVDLSISHQCTTGRQAITAAMTYRHITPKQLKTREMEISNIHFHMALPVDAIFNAIGDLIELAEYALILMSSTQAVSLAYVVFSKKPILLQDLSVWNH